MRPGRWCVVAVLGAWAAWACDGTTSCIDDCGRPVVGDGESCEEADCAPGLVCAGGNGQTCEPPGGVGHQCQGATCAPGLLCDLLNGYVCVEFNLDAGSGEPRRAGP